MQDNVLTIAAARLASVPFRLLGRRPLSPPRRALILRPCCIGQVMLATPLLATLAEAFPEATFDWAVADWARAAIASNPRVCRLISCDPVGTRPVSRAELDGLAERLRAEAYDTVFVPSRSARLCYLAWRAGIPQRIGLDANGRGFAYTVPVQASKQGAHVAHLYGSLAKPFGLEPTGQMEFYPRDRDRATVTRRLLDEIGWPGQGPLVLIHPGGGENPVRPDAGRRWPAERFALVGARLARDHQARIVLVGAEPDRELAAATIGMMHIDGVNLAGRLTLGEFGALAEVADLYVGNDAGSTYVAVAVGCPTVAVFGPSDPDIVAPIGHPNAVRILRPADAVAPVSGEAFSWRDGPSAEAALVLAGEMLTREREVGQLPAVAGD